MGSLSSIAGRKGGLMMGVGGIAAVGAMAFANHAWGAGEIKLGAAADGTGGVPLDGAIGLGGLALAFWKPESKFASYALMAAIGGGGGFAYRVGAAAGDKQASKAHSTSGIAMPPQLAAHFAQPPLRDFAGRVREAA